MITGSICLTDIPKEKIRKAKNDKLYLNLVIWENDEPDRYGNHFSIQVAQTKEERRLKEKKVYIGNLKDWDREEEDMNQEPRAIGEDEDGDKLPF